MFALRSTYVGHIIWWHPFRTFYILLYISWLVIMSSDVTDVWPHDLVILIIVLRIERKIIWKKWNENENNLEFTAFSFNISMFLNNITSLFWTSKIPYQILDNKMWIISNSIKLSTIYTEIKLILEKKIIGLVRPGAAKSIRDASFSFSWIRVGTKDLINIK